MDQREKFWAGLNRQEKKGNPHIHILGIPYDHSVCYRKGASLGPDRIREISQYIPPTLETGENLKSLIIHDLGNVTVSLDPETTFSNAEKVLSDLFSQSFVLTLGGDHSISIPIFKTLDRLSQGRIGILFFDAHTDLSDVFEGSRYSHACPLRRALELPKVDPKDVVLVGTRCFEPEGLRFIDTHQLKYFSTEEILERGSREIGKEIMEHLHGVDHLYLSIDIDVLDPAFAPGTGIPEAGGLSTRDVIRLIRQLDALPIVGADLVEVSPPLDNSDITSFAALKIIMEIFGVVYKKIQRQERIFLEGK
ncbi:MAG TPA: agmatinase [Nitrospiria bacterium]|jgi:agmatinase